MRLVRPLRSARLNAACWARFGREEPEIAREPEMFGTHRPHRTLRVSSAWPATPLSRRRVLAAAAVVLASPKSALAQTSTDALDAIVQPYLTAESFRGAVLVTH